MRAGSLWAREAQVPTVQSPLTSVGRQASALCCLSSHTPRYPVWGQLCLQPPGRPGGPVASPGPSQWTLSIRDNVLPLSAIAVPQLTREDPKSTWNLFCHFPNTFPFRRSPPGNVSSSSAEPRKESRCVWLFKSVLQRGECKLSQKVALSLH